MIKNLAKSYENFLQRFLFIIGAGVLAFALTLTFIWLSLERNQAISVIKEEILKFENSLLAMGYDIAYDNLSFSHISPWQMLRIENLRIYSLDPNHYTQWGCSEFAVSSNIFNTRKIRFHFSQNQTLQVGTHQWNMQVPNSLGELTISKSNQIQDATLQAADIAIDQLAEIGSLKFALQRGNGHQVNDQSPFMETLFELKDIHIDDYTAWPMNKHIDHIYLNANIIGAINEQNIFSESLYNWIEQEGFIDIKKLIINWKPLVMVAKGDLFFNEHLEPDVTLNTSSMALTDTLEKMNQNGWLEDKGVFVVKILLNNKSFKKNQTDQYFTVTTPIKLNNKQILVENIPVWESKQNQAQTTPGEAAKQNK